MILNIDKRLLLFLTLAFIVATVIGTISHECGHYIAAKVMGFDAHISYGMTSLKESDPAMTSKQDFWFILAGPLQTMLTGTIGLLFLFTSLRRTEKLSLKQWILVFISLFWLRQPATLITGIISFLSTGKLPESGDEVVLSHYLHLPDSFMIITTAIIGIIVLSIVVFRFIPKIQRLTFLLSGVIGGIAGYIFWLVLFGKIVMP